ncbi:hypothetical protein J1N35_045179 [Gossypium stocksii]|uniref:Uncharacterized protein n=1 Tax=Gossypium stocksii TaxID=47602 RepID=A0A9D3ZGT8_9ROSI|nr:hypothetical protein J1N35_045179 [Gossypium stocksii]
MKVIRREAIKTWALRKKLGFSVHGDEEEVIEEIMKTEIQRFVLVFMEFVRMVFCGVGGGGLRGVPCFILD